LSKNSGIEKITSELEELNSELSSYSTVWDARKRTFDDILNNLEVLKREVEDEKEEQDRKEGMDEGSDHEEEEGQVTGSQTSGVKGIEERRTREQSRDSGEVDEDVKEQLASSLSAASDTPASKSVEIDMEDAEDEDEVNMVGADTKMEVD
jgi:DNA gyrase/topoisomerase IV subunit A